MKRKPYWEMTSRELAEATKQFDEPFVVDQSRPLNSVEREQWNRLKRKKRKPKAGQGVKKVSVRHEEDLIQRVTALAKKRRISRSKLFAEVLEEALAQQG
jgi:CRISPR/Cas system CSM-associated protein Csm2 small subunit